MAETALAVYPGTFDPVTNGHLDVIERAVRTFGRLIVMVATNPRKKPLFSIDERIEMLRENVTHLPDVEIDRHGGLLVDYLHKRGATVIVRGLRAISDFEFEFQMALMNRKLAPEIETYFLVPDEAYTYLSSSVVREIARLGGDIAPFVPEGIIERIRKRVRAEPC